MARRVYIHAFKAMGTTFTLGIVGSDANPLESWRRLLWARLQIQQWERRLSRFLPGSELSRLNGSSKPRRVSPALGDLLLHAVEANRRTCGLFDATVLPQLQAAGYTGPWDGSGPRAGTTVGMASAVRGEIVPLPGRRFWLSGAVDLGGLAKGWVADRLVARLGRGGGVFVDAGGDVAVRGCPPGGAGWLVEIEGIPGAEPIAEIRLRGGGMATSSVLRRRWYGPRGPAHHIIDPRTGEPADSDLVSATVVAPRALTAEWAAKAVLIAGSVEGMALAEAWGLPVVALRRDGSILKNRLFQSLEYRRDK